MIDQAALFAPAPGPLRFSPTIGAIAAALAKAQASLKPAIKDSVNPQFKSKYADLGACYEASRPALTSNGIAVIQGPSTDGSVTVTTILLHSSGEWIMCSVSAQPRDGSPQAVGSAITYLRRYSLCSMVGISADEDDDGEASQPPRQDQDHGRSKQVVSAPTQTREPPKATTSVVSIFNSSDLGHQNIVNAVLRGLTVPEPFWKEISARLHGRPISDCKQVAAEVRAGPSVDGIPF